MIEIEEMVREIRKKDKEEIKLSLSDFIPPDKKFKTYKQLKSELVNRDKRKDGRTVNTHRKMFIQLGSVSDARGSCYIELGDTKLVVSVRGPKEIPNIQEYTELCVLECLVEYAPFVTNPTSDEKFMAEAMRLALEPVLCRHEFPNLQITISAFIIEDGGSALSTSIVGANLALTHARLPTFGLLSAVTLGIHNGIVLVDPTKEEEDFCTNPFSEKLVSEYGLITFAFMKELDQVTLCQMNGCANADIFLKVLQTLTFHCNDVHNLCAQHLMRELKIAVRDLAEVKKSRELMENLNISNNPS